MRVLAVHINVSKQLQEVVVNWGLADLFHAFLLLRHQPLFDFLLLLAVLELLVAGLIGQRHLRHLVVLQA